MTSRLFVLIAAKLERRGLVSTIHEV